MYSTVSENMENSPAMYLPSTSPCSEHVDAADETMIIDALPEDIFETCLETARMLVNEGVCNCKLCGIFFTGAVYSVQDTGFVCETCLEDSEEETGERIGFFDTFLNDLRVFVCANFEMGCKKVLLLSEDLEAHMKDCQYRPVDCPSVRCFWYGKHEDFLKHYEETHQTDVISEATALKFNVAVELPMAEAWPWPFATDIEEEMPMPWPWEIESGDKL